MFRKDIQGLRAVAVLPVVIFHAGFDVLAGGFIGVDVFFIISGYLIAGIIEKELGRKSFHLIDFYIKRIRRLYPALMTTILATVIVGFFVFMPEEFTELGQSIVAVSTYTSNIFFWLKSDYFDGPSILKPLLHTWSLSIEEQFYLVFPALLILLRNATYRFKCGTIITLILLSFLSCLYFSYTSPSTAFFIGPFRFWELLLGAYLKISRIEDRVAEHIKVFLGYLGAITLLLLFFTVSENDIFPGVIALATCISTCALIASYNHQSLSKVSEILSSKPFQVIGDSSYSIYLIHWPIIVYYNYWRIAQPTVNEKVGLIIFSLVAGWLMHRFVENIFKTSENKKQISNRFVILSTGLFSFLAIIVGTSIHLKNGFPSRFDENLVRNSLQKQTKNPVVGKHCFLKSKQGFSLWSGEKCFIINHENSENILLWGDSHANHLKFGVAELRGKLKQSVILYANSGCAPILNQSPVGRDFCKKNNAKVFDIIEEFNIAKVVLASNWSYAEKIGVDISQLSTTISTLLELGVEVSLITQLPVYPINNPNFLLYRLSQSGKDINDYWLNPKTGGEINDRIINIAENNGVDYFDPFRFFCSDKGCHIYQNRELVVIDSAHLSEIGSQLVANKIATDLPEFLSIMSR